jgi:NAD(P)H dehydrogenase (quinone)
MKKILVIIAHPSDVGHNREILKNVEKELKEKNISYEVIDLYKMKFDPMMKKSEYLHSKDKKIEKDIQILQEKVLECEKMIFIFPVWWNSVPAGLKGFFDRVFSSGFAYRYVKILKYFRSPRPLLNGRKAAVIMTTGSPKAIFNTVLGARAAKVVCRDTLGFCGIKSKTFYYANAYKLNEKTAVELPRLASRAVNWIVK